MPSVYTLFRQHARRLLFPELSLWGKIAIGIALALLTAAFNVVTPRLGKWLPNPGAALKLLAVLALGVSGLHFGWNHGFAPNDFRPGLHRPVLAGQMAALGSDGLASWGPSWPVAAPRRCAATRAATSRARCRSRAGSSRLQHLRRHPRRAGRGTGQETGHHPDLRPCPLEHLRPRRRRRDARRPRSAPSSCSHLFTNMVALEHGTNRAAVEAAKAGATALFGGPLRHGTRRDRLWRCWPRRWRRLILLLYGLVAHTAGLALDPASIFAAGFACPVMCADVPGAVRRRRPRPRPYRMPLGDWPVWALFVAVLAGIYLFVVTPGAPMDRAYAGQDRRRHGAGLAVGELLIRQAARRRGVMSHCAMPTVEEAALSQHRYGVNVPLTPLVDVVAASTRKVVAERERADAGRRRPSGRDDGQAGPRCLST
ncbi:hypothetical protein ACPA9J_04120 [Pseudomonas aeruginosa]